MKINRATRESIWLALTVLAMTILAFKSSEDPMLAAVNSEALISFLSQFKTGNQIVFDLSIGVLVSIAMYIAVVRIPEARKRARARNSLAAQYKNFREDVIVILLSAERGSYPGELPRRLLDKEAFKEYFKEKVGMGQDRWDLAFTNIDEYGIRQLRSELDILIEEIRYTLHSVDIQSDEAFSVIKSLQQVSHRMKSHGLEYDDKKSLFRFLWSVCSGYSFVTGYADPDKIEDVISSI